MVDRPADRRNEPVYDLVRIQELARNGWVVYASSRVESDAENLDYGPDDVAACIVSLTPEEFDESLLYPGENFWQDVYRCRRTSPGGKVDDLYIKFRLGPKFVTVVLQSFHRDR